MNSCQRFTGRNPFKSEKCGFLTGRADREEFSNFRARIERLGRLICPTGCPANFVSSAGMPGVPVYSLLLVCFLPIQSAHEAAGAAGTRHSPRPPWGRKINAQLGCFAPRDREVAFSRHCERSEAIHLAAQRKNRLLRRFAPRNDYDCIVVGRLKALKLVCAKCFFPWSTKPTRHART
jgi:hypothetical protein